jgi:RNA recognition motif-containing protein
MGIKLRINNLSEDTTEEDLRTLFSGVGTIVSARISREEETGQSRGYGFVRMASADAAQSAISALNGHLLKGQTIRVGKVRPPADKSRRPGERREPRRRTPPRL